MSYDLESLAAVAVYCKLLMNSKKGTLTYNTKTKQTVVLAEGEDYPHGLIYALGKLWMVINTGPGKLIRFNNPNDLTDYTTLTFANDGKHNFPRDLILLNGKIMVTFLAIGRVVVSEIDPVSLAVVDRINSTDGTGGASICAAAGYLFVSAQISDTTSGVLRFLISDWSAQGSAELNVPGAYSARFDGTNIYLVGENTPGWIARIDPVTLANELAMFDTGEDNASDNPAFFGDYVWCGMDSVQDHVIKVRKSDLSMTRVPVGEAHGTYTLFSDGQYLWRGVEASNPGYIQRITPSTGKYYNMILDVNLTSDIVEDEQGRLYIASDTQPGQLTRLTPKFK